MGNCIKCGKEIDDGNMCNECKSKNKTPLIIAIVVVVVVALVLGFGFFSANNNSLKNTPIGKIFKFMRIDNNLYGNTVANLENYGYAVEGDKYIFYILPDEEAKYMNIWRMDKNGKNEQIILQKNWNVISLNLVKNNLYFIGYETTEEGSTSKIYKMDIDGKDIQEITDDISQSSTNIYVYDNEIYYLNGEYKTCKIGLDGGESQIVSDDANGYIAIVDGWIYFIDYDTENYAMCKKKLDGSENVTITGDIMYDLNIIDGDLYYVNREGKFCKKHNDDEEVVISDIEIYNINISENKVYYMRYIEPGNQESSKVGLYRMDIDGKNEIMLKEFKSYSSFINVVGDWIMISDQDDESGYMSLVKKDGSDEKVLYKINFSNMATYDETDISNENVQASDVTVNENGENQPKTTDETTENAAQETTPDSDEE